MRPLAILYTSGVRQGNRIKRSFEVVINYQVERPRAAAGKERFSRESRQALVSTLAGMWVNRIKRVLEVVKNDQEAEGRGPDPHHPSDRSGDPLESAHWSPFVHRRCRSLISFGWRSDPHRVTPP